MFIFKRFIINTNGVLNVVEMIYKPKILYCVKE